MSYRDVRGRWIPAARGRTRAAGAPLMAARGRRPRLRDLARFVLGAALAWLLVDAGYWLLLLRDPALRLDPCRGLVPVSRSQALRTNEGFSYQSGFNEAGSVVLPAPRHPRARVVLLGDSESAGYALEPRFHYGTRLAARFPDVEFFCDAQPNYSIADHLRLARCSRGFADFDLVVIQGSERDAGAEAFSSARGRGLAVAAIGDTGVSITAEPLGWVGRHLDLFNAVTRFDAVGHRLMVLARGVARVITAPRAGPPPQGAAAPDAVDPAAMEALLEALRREVKPPIVWLYVPRMHGVGDARRLDDRHGEVLLRGCGNAGIEWVDPSAVLLRFRSAAGGYANGGVLTLPGTGHLNAEGHRLLFEAVAPAVSRHVESGARRR